MPRRVDPHLALAARSRRAERSTHWAPQRTPNAPVSLDALRAVGVLHYEMPTEDRITFLNRIADERQYKNRDEVCGLVALAHARARGYAA